MGFSWQYDDARQRQVLHFACACGAERCERVTVTRADGSPYSTAFVQCVACHAMYHWPGELPVTVLQAYGGTPPGGDHPAAADADFMARVQAAAERARRSRRRR